MLETATKTKRTVFANDEDGNDICVGNHVVHNRKLYRVQALKRGVAGAALHEESVYLELIHLKSLQIEIVEACGVTLVD